MQFSYLNAISIQKRSLAIVSVLLLSLAVMLASGACSRQESANSGPSPILVETLTAKQDSRELVNRYAGYIHPWDAHGVGFLVGGRVQTINVNQGDTVTRGQLLATLNADDYRLVKQLAEAQLTAIKPNYERVSELVKKDALPQSKLDELSARYQAAMTQKQQAERQIMHTRLVSQLDGVVHELRTAEGQVIAQGSAALVILQIDKLKLKFGVTQKDLGFFKTGLKLDVTVQGIETPFEGVVDHIDFVADPTTRTYNVVVAIDNSDKQLRPSMLAHVSISTETLEGVFVPIQAIMRDTSGAYIVMTLDENDIIQPREIERGRRFDGEYQITKGLTPGDRIVIKGHSFAKAGDKAVLK